VRRWPPFWEVIPHPKLQAFFAQYPNIDLELRTAPDLEDLIAHGLDIAIHNGPLSDSSLIVRKIASVPVIVVASPSYIDRKALRRTWRISTNMIALSSLRTENRFPGNFLLQGRDIRVKPRGRFRTHDAEQIRAAVLAGLGVAQTPGWLFTREVASGRVVRVLRNYEPMPSPSARFIRAVEGSPSKARVFAQFVAKCLAEDTMFTSVCYESLSKGLACANAFWAVRGSTYATQAVGYAGP